MEAEVNVQINNEVQERNNATIALNRYANLLEGLYIKGKHDNATRKEQEDLRLPSISVKDISPGNIASIQTILAQAREDNFQWDHIPFRDPWIEKMQGVYVGFRSGGASQQSTEMGALIQKRKKYLDSLLSKVSDTSNFPENETDIEAADALNRAFGQLEKMAKKISPPKEDDTPVSKADLAALYEDYG